MARSIIDGPDKAGRYKILSMIGSFDEASRFPGRSRAVAHEEGARERCMQTTNNAGELQLVCNRRGSGVDFFGLSAMADTRLRQGRSRDVSARLKCRRSIAWSVRPCAVSGFVRPRRVSGAVFSGPGAADNQKSCDSAWRPFCAFLPVENMFHFPE